MTLTNPWNIILFFAISAVAVSYGWGMRGTTLGGEKGAMLPGALMGLMLAVFSGSDFLREHFYLLSAAGALGLYFGGTMSYMQSIGLTSDKNPPEDFKRGMTGIFVKGCIWWGIFGSVVGMFLSFLSGRYYNSLRSVLLIFGLLPLFALAGSRLFDRPFDAQKGIHPRIYFSRNRPEGMGVLFGVLVELVIVMAISRDTVGLALMGGSALSGGVGWMLGQLLHIRGKWPNKRGWQFLGKHQKRGWIDTLKIEECAYGACTALGVCITFTLIANCSFHYRAYYADLSLPSLTGTKEWALPAIFLALLGIDMLRYVIRRRKTEQELRYMRSRGWMSDAELELALQNPGKEPSRGWLLYEKIAETATFPIYCVVPLLFLFLGSAEVAKLVSFYVMYYVMVEQQAFERFNRFKTIYLWRGLLLGIGGFMVFAQFHWGWTPGLLPTVLLYGAYYEAMTLVGNTAKRSPDRYGRKTIRESSLREAYGGLVTVHGYFLICIAIVTAFAARL